MALPSSGQLSFSAIAGELGAGSPYSLRSMSNTAGKSTPDSVSEFYGYSAAITYTYYTNYALNDPCDFSYFDIYSGSDGKYYVDLGTYSLMYNYSPGSYWYEYLYYEPLLDADVYREWEINAASTTLSSNGNVLINCFI